VQTGKRNLNGGKGKKGVSVAGMGRFQYAKGGGKKKCKKTGGAVGGGPSRKKKVKKLRSGKRKTWIPVHNYCDKRWEENKKAEGHQGGRGVIQIKGIKNFWKFHELRDTPLTSKKTKTGRFHTGDRRGQDQGETI